MGEFSSGLPEAGAAAARYSVQWLGSEVVQGHSGSENRC